MNITILTTDRTKAVRAAQETTEILLTAIPEEEIISHSNKESRALLRAKESLRARSLLPHLLRMKKRKGLFPLSLIPETTTEITEENPETRPTNRADKKAFERKFKCFFIIPSY